MLKFRLLRIPYIRTPSHLHSVLDISCTHAIIIICSWRTVHIQMWKLLFLIYKVFEVIHTDKSIDFWRLTFLVEEERAARNGSLEGKNGGFKQKKLICSSTHISSITTSGEINQGGLTHFQTTTLISSQVRSDGRTHQFLLGASTPGLGWAG